MKSSGLARGIDEDQTGDRSIKKRKVYTDSGEVKAMALVQFETVRFLESDVPSEEIWINPAEVAYIYRDGGAVLGMSDGTKVEVSMTPEELVELINGYQARSGA